MRMTLPCFILATALLAAVAPLPLQASPASATPPVASPTGPAPGSAAPATPLQQFHDTIKTASLVAFSDGQPPATWAAANEVLVKALADPLFEQLTPVEQGKALSGAGWAAIRLSQFPRARDLLARATRLDPADAWHWLWLAKLEAELGNHDAAATALAACAGRSLEVLEEELPFVLQVIRASDDASPARLQLMQVLFDAGWEPLPLGASAVWHRLALARLQRGERDAAAAAVARITAPDALVRVRSDKRFDGIVDRDAPAFDVELAAGKQADALQVRTILDSTKLQNSADLLRAMLVTGMNDAVLQITGRILAAIAAAGDAKPFVDMHRQAWIMNIRSIALARAGRTDEALAILERAANRPENGQANANQRLNLGHFHCGLGHAAETLAAAASAGPMNGYGRMVQAHLQHCGALLGQDSAAADKALAFLRVHQEDNPTAFLLALLRADRMDEAATVVIARLADAGKRDQMLFDLQDFLEPAPLPADKAATERWQALRNREDVRDAVDRVGRIEKYEIYAP